MKVWKLVSGIISIVLFAVVSFQSCAVGVADALGDGKDGGGSAGIMVAFLMLAGGIVSITTRKVKGMGGNIALIVLFGIASACAFGGSSKIYGDLPFWGAWCLVNCILAIVSLIKNKRANKLNRQEDAQNLNDAQS